MKKYFSLLKFLVLFFIITAGTHSFAAEETGTSNWQFTYPDWKLKALTFSYDDGVIEDRELVKIFNRYNIKATFNVSMGRAVKRPERFIQPEEMQELYRNHEIASHGFLHRGMGKLNDQALTAEIADNQKALAELLGKEPPGFAYPYGRHTTENAPDRIYKELAKHNLLYARTCQRKKDFDLPSNWLAWSPNGHHKSGKSICNRFKKFKPQKMSVCYIWGHSYEFVQKGQSWEDIENICKIISGQPDIWYATNGEIALYVRACRAAEKASKFPEITNPTEMTLYLQIDGKKITIPPKSSRNIK